MTREEAITDIRDNIKPIVGGISLDIAIQALSQEPCTDAISRIEALKIATTEYELKKIRELPSVNPQPCDDAISRQDAIDAIYEHEFSNWCDKDEVSTILNDLPSIMHKPIECDDAISREDVEECKELMTDINGDTVYAVRMSDIRQLPFRLPYS